MINFLIVALSKGKSQLLNGPETFVSKWYTFQLSYFLLIHSVNLLHLFVFEIWMTELVLGTHNKKVLLSCVNDPRNRLVKL